MTLPRTAELLIVGAGVIGAALGLLEGALGAAGHNPFALERAYVTPRGKTR